jgi:hypothetical protein
MPDFIIRETGEVVSNTPKAGKALNSTTLQIADSN